MIDTNEIAQLLVETLNLDEQANVLDVNAPLFGDGGLALDSIDALEIAYAIAKNYGVQIRSDDANNQNIFANIQALTDFVNQQKAN